MVDSLKAVSENFGPSLGALQQKEDGTWRSPIEGLEFNDGIILVTMYQISRGLPLEPPGILSYAVRRVRKSASGLWMQFLDLSEQEAESERKALSTYIGSNEAVDVLHRFSQNGSRYLAESVALYRTQIDTVVMNRPPTPPPSDRGPSQ